MGSLCSKSGTVSGGHQVLGSASSSTGPPDGTRPDPRIAAAEAAERRQKASHARGIQSANPNAGRLAAQLEAQKSAPRVPEPRQQEQLVTTGTRGFVRSRQYGIGGVITTPGTPTMAASRGFHALHVYSISRAVASLISSATTYHP
ncbi:hypothetical protein C2E23DRAFT_348698 [Lenzites betulinus]|nr:hypothetical protein C2E23DRAFT_348698 [Lenzites betulinus]